MSAPARLAAFVLVLVLSFAGGAALGAAFGPETESPRPATHTTHEVGR